MKLMKKQQRNLNNMDEEIRFRQCKICGKEFNSNGFQLIYDDNDDNQISNSSIIGCYPEKIINYETGSIEVCEYGHSYNEVISNYIDLRDYEDLYFCSIECLKEFFNKEIGKLELGGGIDFHIPGVRF